MPKIDCFTEVSPEQMEAEFKSRSELVNSALSPDFGDGWMSQNARDMLRIAIFAGFDPKVMIRQLILRSAKRPKSSLNERSVLAVMGELTNENE